MIYDMLEERLAEVGFIPGETLFREMFPAEVDTGVFLRLPLNGVQIRRDMKNWYRTRFQLVTRHIDPVDGLVLAQKASKALTILSLIEAPASAERGPAHITHFLPETLPVRFPALVGNAVEWSQYFDAAFGFEPLP